ncbi:copper-transporting ATPase [Cystobacter fuscus]|uniref:Copper-transporting ATPase n=1 Tax=Cystobacter fuscus TaxID=43 RepID=A0A250JDZ7_9BACT|nr:heavy metal-binding domain-containing protein [Cystobacter fuscus]ATB42134.1 copper-transporting ATPase [Cystobacter fuscus]
MHPEIVRDEPGACPTCGMVLEPRTVLPEEAPDPELAVLALAPLMQAPFVTFALARHHLRHSVTGRFASGRIALTFIETRGEPLH